MRDGLAANVGGGCGTSVRELAEMLAKALGHPIPPVCNGEFRPGEVRDLTSDSSCIQAIGYTPEVDLAAGIARYISNES